MARHTIERLELQIASMREQLVVADGRIREKDEEIAVERAGRKDAERELKRALRRIDRMKARRKRR